MSNDPCTPPRLNYINVGKGGTFHDSGIAHTQPADVDTIIAHLSSSSIQHLVLHFHGGLVSEKNGLCVAESMIPVYQAANAHPLTFVWETGALETLRDNLTEIHQTELFKKLLKFLLKKGLEKLGLTDGARGPGIAPTDAEIEAELQKETPFSDYQINTEFTARSINITSEALLEGEFQNELLLDRSVSDLLNKENEEREGHGKALILTEGQTSEEARALFSWIGLAKTLAKIAWRVIKRFYGKTDHDFYPTVMEEFLREVYIADLGAWGWKQMKDKAAEMWLPNDGLTGDKQHAGRYFLDQLVTLVSHNASFKVSLVGHSAGSVVICKMLDLVYSDSKYASLRGKIDTIAFLAPACTSQLFHDSIVTQEARFTHFRMYTMSDEYEKADKLVPYIYTHSLLYMISGILEDDVDTPIAGMQRYLSGEAPYKNAVLDKISDWLTKQNRLVLSVTDTSAAIGFRSSSQKHGDFDDDPLTRESLTAILS